MSLGESLPAASGYLVRTRGRAAASAPRTPLLESDLGPASPALPSHIWLWLISSLIIVPTLRHTHGVPKILFFRMDTILIWKRRDVREEIPLSGRELDCRPVEEVVFDYRTISWGQR